MDAMFNNGNHYHRLNNNNGHTIVTPDDNDVIVDVENDDEQSLTDALQSSINKRKLANNGVINHEQQNQTGNNTAKRLCTMTEHH
jgi:hypothetical protein